MKESAMTHNDKTLLMAALQGVTPLKPTTRIPHARTTLHLPKRPRTVKPKRKVDAYATAFWAYKV
jgi:hypothetical protein